MPTYTEPVTIIVQFDQGSQSYLSAPWLRVTNSEDGDTLLEVRENGELRVNSQRVLLSGGIEEASGIGAPSHSAQNGSRYTDVSGNGALWFRSGGNWVQVA